MNNQRTKLYKPPHNGANQEDSKGPDCRGAERSPRGRRKRNTLLDLGFWHCLCLLSVDQQYFRSSRASGWACDEKSLDSCLMLKVTKDKATNGSWWKPREPINNFVPTEFTLKKRRWLLFFYSVH
ncbi:stress-associated endoplasmic reticulum protein 2 isoform X3 [Hyperolius riggenbachi]|uniref:stress-associated endoplasmic reticulum protein 2 isoform X3 n=1 Tax=Hyperolius riggenbachi TaxID=752182 RepID=UPI0035A3CC1F